MKHCGAGITQTTLEGMVPAIAAFSSQPLQASCSAPARTESRGIAEVRARALQRQPAASATKSAWWCTWRNLTRHWDETWVNSAVRGACPVAKPLSCTRLCRSRCSKCHHRKTNTPHLYHSRQAHARLIGAIAEAQRAHNTWWQGVSSCPAGDAACKSPQACVKIG